MFALFWWINYAQLYFSIQGTYMNPIIKNLNNVTTRTVFFNT